MGELTLDLRQEKTSNPSGKGTEVFQDAQTHRRAIDYPLRPDTTP